MERLFNEFEPELMDRPQPVTGELESTLRQLAFLNEHFGGHRFVRRFLSRSFRKGESVHALDLAAGGGDFPRAMVNWGRSRGVHLKVDAVDANSSILRIAAKMSGEYPQISFHSGDALTFDAEQQYDLVHCSLVLHHFNAEDAVKLLRHARKLSRRCVLVTDLERSWFTRFAVWTANRLLIHTEMTRRDGDTSVQRAFSFAEAHSLAIRAGWTKFGHRRFLFCRQALWMELPE